MKTVIKIALLTLACFVVLSIMPVFADEPTVINSRYTIKTEYQDGRTVLDTYTYPVNYYDSGTWLTIEPDYYEPDEGEYTAVFSRLPYIVRINENDGARRIYFDRNDLSYYLDIGKPYDNMGPVQRSGGSFTWDYPNAAINVKIENTGVKFTFTLKNENAPDSITVPYSAVGISRQGSYLYHNGAVIGKLSHPYAIDAAGNYRDCSVEFTPGYIMISLDTNGLVYPVEVDPTVDVQIANAYNDASEVGDDTGFSNSQSVFSIFSSTVAAQRINGGFRFPSVDIPQGSIIDVAYPEVSVTSTGADDANMKIYCEDVDNSNDFNTEQDVNDRPRTTAYTSWVADGVGTGWQGSSLDITGPIQEVIDRTGWTAENALTLLMIGNSDIYRALNVRTYDGYPSYGAKLHVEYTAPASGPPGPVLLTITQTGLESVTANWTADGASAYQVTGSYDGWTTSYTLYSGAANSANYTGWDLNSTVYSIKVVATNDAGSSSAIESIGGGEVEIVLPTGVYVLGAAFALIFISFFLKSPLIYLAIIPCMVGVLVEPAFKDLWFQSGCVFVMIWAALAFYKQITERMEG